MNCCCCCSQSDLFPPFVILFFFFGFFQDSFESLPLHEEAPELLLRGAEAAEAGDPEKQCLAFQHGQVKAGLVLAQKERGWKSGTGRRCKINRRIWIEKVTCCLLSKSSLSFGLSGVQILKFSKEKQS